MKPKVGMYILLNQKLYDQYWVKIGKIVFVSEKFIKIKAIEYTTDDADHLKIFKKNNKFDINLPFDYLYTLHKDMDSLLAKVL